MEAREGPNTQDQAGRLMVASGHLFEDVTATYHPPCIDGEVAETSSNTQFAFRQHWKKYRVDCHRHDLSSVFMTVGDADTVHLGRSLSTEKLVRIGVGHGGPQEPEHSRQK